MHRITSQGKQKRINGDRFCVFMMILLSAAAMSGCSKKSEPDTMQRDQMTIEASDSIQEDQISTDALVRIQENQTNAIETETALHARDKPDIKTTADENVQLPKDYADFSMVEPDAVNIEDVAVDQEIRWILEEDYDEQESEWILSENPTDHWVQENTDYGSVEEWKAAVRSNLEQTAQRNAERACITGWITQLVEKSICRVAEADVEMLTQTRIEEKKEAAIIFGESYESLVLNETGMNTEQYETTLRKAAEEELRKKCILYAFAETYDVDMTESSWQSFLEKEAGFYGYSSGSLLLQDMDEIGLKDSIFLTFLEQQCAARLSELCRSESLQTQDLQ